MSNDLQELKKRLRNHYKGVRKEIDKVRREEAKESLPFYLEEYIAPAKRVLSFFHVGDEVNLSLVNELLLTRDKLVLPRLEGNMLSGYLVRDLGTELSMGKHKILEPNPNFCTRERKVDCILVPGVAFDKLGNRLGSGYGYYDRLIAEMPNCLTIGIGFREQLSPDILPVESHDKQVEELCLV